MRGQRVYIMFLKPTIEPSSTCNSCNMGMRDLPDMYT